MRAQSRKKNKGLIVAGMYSSAGKTAVTSLLLAALRKRNIALQPFKVGPDYIDPGYHFHFSATHSVNLDPWIMGRENVIQAAQKFTENAIGLAEGVMGLLTVLIRQTIPGVRWNWHVGSSGRFCWSCLVKTLGGRSLRQFKVL